MKIEELINWEEEKRLLDKVNLEYSQADNYTREWKDDVENIASTYLIPKPQKEKIKVRKVLNNLTIRLSIFLWDKLQVVSVPWNGKLGRDIAEAQTNVLEYNHTSMNFKNKYRSALIDDALYWVWVLAVDWWDNHEQEPILSYIDARLTYPDPNNWQWDNMRFFGTKLKKGFYELEMDEAYDTERVRKVRYATDTDQQDVKRANDRQKGNDTIYQVDENNVSIYNHITIWKSDTDKEPHLYLSTWDANRTTLLRLVKMRALTPWEKANPEKISLWVRLFRSKPLKGSYAWVSLIDDVWQYQDLETLLYNLQIEQAKEAGLGWRTFVDEDLGIDIDDMATNDSAWAIIPYKSIDQGKNASNSITIEPQRPTNPIVSNTINALNQLSQLAEPTWNSQVQWLSQSGTQTKAEVQTIQQNINQVLSYMASNYMDAIEWIFTDIIRSYAANMSSQRKKSITLIDTNWEADNYWYKKADFISSDWTIYIVVKSKAQEDIRKEKDFVRLLSVYSNLKQTLDPNSTSSKMLDRLLVEKSGIEWVDAYQIVQYTPDERKAYQNLILLNNDIELKSTPQPWEDHEVYINIYRQWIETKARDKAIQQRELALEQTPKQQPQIEQWASWISNQISASLLASQQAQWQPASIWDVQI